MNGYCEFEIKGEKVGLKFGMIANQRFLEKAKSFTFFETMSDGQRTLTVLGIAHVLYAGYVNNCYIKEQVTKHTFEDFFELIEDDFFVGKLRESVSNAIKEWSESRYIKQLIDDSKENGDEKKNPKKKKVKKMPGTK